MRKNLDVVAWSNGDLMDIGPEIMVRSSKINPWTRPVSQEKKPRSPAMNGVIKAGTNRLIEAVHT